MRIFRIKSNKFDDIYWFLLRASFRTGFMIVDSFSREPGRGEGVGSLVCPFRPCAGVSYGLTAEVVLEQWQGWWWGRGAERRGRVSGRALSLAE